MSKVIDEFKFEAGARASKYDWTKWFDGQIHVLDSEDFGDRDPAGFRVTALIRARKRGLELRTAVRDGEVVLQVVGKRE
jgi:hypothetical protein